MKEFIESIKDFCQELIKDYPEEKKQKAIMSYQRFNEYLLRLDIRHSELLFLESERMHNNLEELEIQNITIADLQIQFLDKTEAFHQQVYATISSFIQLLIHVGMHKFKNQMPIDSNTKFLRYISEKSYDSVVKDQAAILLKSVDFRSKFIDHPQQHVMHDWMTFSHLTGTCIIYFVPNGNEIYARDTLDPYDANFEPPVNYKTFYVSPAHTEVFVAVSHFTKRVLEALQH